MRRLLALLLLACAGTAGAQAPCPEAWEVKTEQMFGVWHAQFAGEWDTTIVLLEKHPDYAGNFRGGVKRAGGVSQATGDIDEGDFTLEESADGVHITAAWIGEIVDGSCGKEIRGTWKADGAKEGKDFVLRKQ